MINLGIVNSFEQYEVSQEDLSIVQQIAVTLLPASAAIIGAAGYFMISESGIIGRLLNKVLDKAAGNVAKQEQMIKDKKEILVHIYKLARAHRDACNKLGSDKMKKVFPETVTNKVDDYIAALKQGTQLSPTGKYTYAEAGFLDANKVSEFLRLFGNSQTKGREMKSDTKIAGLSIMRQFLSVTKAIGSRLSAFKKFQKA